MISALLIAVVALVSPSSGAPITTGAGSTSFTFALPSGAACAHDSASGGSRVQAFLVPAAVDLDGVHFSAKGPEVAGGMALSSNGSSFVDHNTALQTGLVLGLPAFEGSNIPVRAGRYVIGVACTTGTHSVADRMWTVDIEVGGISAGADVQWRVVSPSGKPTVETAPAVVRPAAGTVQRGMASPVPASASSTARVAPVAHPLDVPAAGEPRVPIVVTGDAATIAVPVGAEQPADVPHSVAWAMAGALLGVFVTLLVGESVRRRRSLRTCRSAEA